jgi:outer membrane protein assembly factor BamB
MKNNIIIFVVLLCSTLSCRKDEDPIIQKDEDGVIISQMYKWKYPLHEKNTFNSNGNFDYPIIYNKNIAIPTTDTEGNRRITMIETDEGDFVWNWNDIFPVFTIDFYISYNYIHGNLLTWQSGSRSYCINLENGATYWKLQRDKTYDIRINSYESNYLTYSYKTNTDGYEEYIAYLGNIQTGELTEFLKPNLSASYISPRGIGGVNFINEIPENNNLLLVTYTEPLPEWCVNSFFGLYNTQTQEWIYERKLLVPPLWNTSVFHTPIIYNEKAYANVGNNIVCHDLYTGEQIWRREFDQDFLFSGFIIENDKIIANNENLTLYCLNPETGYDVWTGEGAGTSSRMSYMNGIVYFVGGSDGDFHAVDIETGETVWRLDAKKLEVSNGIFKTNAVYVIPGENNEKGKVIALTHMYAYCFEAYQ